jgi:translation initiation factor 1
MTVDPFKDASGLSDFNDFNKNDLNSTGGGLIHIRIQQRNGRKTLTTVQGISEEFDKKKLVKAFKKEFACNGTVIEHSEYGEVVQLQGDQRQNVCEFLTRNRIAKEDQLKVSFSFKVFTIYLMSRFLI